ncbi:MAG: CPBP family intramembrane metalloprotease [Chloroflexi bacterium]|nr:MAG: CPBP family intramembrane metalloprotease [Chloroflexota bacterium]
MVNILLLSITVLSIFKIIFSSDSIEILMDVIILDFGAIYVIYEIVKRYHVKPDLWLGINKFKIENLRYAGFYFIAWPVIIIWSQIIEFFDLDFFKSTNYSEEIFSSLNNNYLAIFIMACIVAPICEEIIFRGYFFRVLKERFNLLFAIITNSIFFGLIHFEPSAIVPATILGVSLTLIRLKAKSLLLPITIHALHNLLAFIVTYLTL